MNGDNHTQYIIRRKIGEGGMGVVYLAEDTLLERSVAIKELNLATVPVSEQSGNRFQQEALALARLNHPNITHLYAFLPKDDTYWMVMEYVNGKTVEEWLQFHGPMQPDVACSIIVQILDGLHHAHRKGIIHRDLKPANVMISEEGEVKIMDFGIARIRNSQRMTQHGKSVGTLEYMAPEQIQGKEGDERTDVYAAGNILYELFCGQPPFRADTDYHLMKAKLEEPPPLLPALLNVSPPMLKNIILKALERNPERRFATVTDFRDALHKCIQTPLLKEQSLIYALTNSVSTQAVSGNLQVPRPSHKWKLPDVSLPAGFLRDLSFHSRRVSDQFVKLLSLKQGSGSQHKSFKKGIGGFFSRFQQLITENALGFLVIVVLICGILLLLNYFSGPGSDQTGAIDTAGQTLPKVDTSNEQENNPDNAYIIETQLSKVPAVNPDAVESKEEDAEEKPSSPKEKSKKKNDPPKDKSPRSDPPQDKTADQEPPAEPDPAPVKREPTHPVNIPAGRSVSMLLDENLSSEEPERDGNAITLRCAEDIMVEGRTIIRKGAIATGKIVDVVPSNKRKRAVIGFIIQKVEGSNGSMVKVHSERFQLIASSPGTPAVYRTGQMFYAKLGRGRFE